MLGKSGRCMRFKAAKDPKRIRNVVAENRIKIVASRASVVEKTRP
jgi:hypothetical protein